ncbi:hypothetical protein TH53_05890 [Pedobacter lusitanus]|uniref:Contig25, whole genome shotgun sequence n=1 Tax=Pedobacter lusitanus TaxID=1503925 RepID=A0A0D0FZJ6_9SPHI|nr:hypothetical protein [Pedobacter lusitanus]KIO77969.1 hypothetical protein TH53_05890 [Pedobacter lusitanus]
MKGKKFTYLLIVCVAGVWGIIFYRIYAGLEQEDELPVAIVSKGKPEYFKLVNHETDRVALNLNYRDPFAVISSPVKSIADPAAVQHEVKLLSTPVMPKPMVNWSAIQYTGYINNPSTKSRIAIIKVNGREGMLTEGQSLEGLKLIKNAGDSVKVRYQNSTKYISLK